VASLTLLDLYKKYQPEAFKKVKVLAMFTTAPSNIMSKIPIKTLADLKGCPHSRLRRCGTDPESLGRHPGGNAHAGNTRSPSEGCCQGTLFFPGSDERLQICRTVQVRHHDPGPVYPFAVVMNMASGTHCPRMSRRFSMT
jgi:hypothetical protein